MKKIQIGWKRLTAILKNVVKMAEIRYIFQTLTRPKLPDQFQPNFTQLFYSIGYWLQSYRLKIFKMDAVQRRVPRNRM